MRELLMIHGGIGSRREAAWLMRLWSAVLDRLASYLEDGVRATNRSSSAA
jgi:hypothetical protein